MTNPSQSKSHSTLVDLYAQDALKACRLALRRTRDMDEQERLEEINRLLGGHGTEAIRGEWQNGYWCDVVAAYVNMGDTYDLTVMQVRGETRSHASKFIVTSWGDFVERNAKRYGIE